jgi:hypothetical protein
MALWTRSNGWTYLQQHADKFDYIWHPFPPFSKPEFTGKFPIDEILFLSLFFYLIHYGQFALANAPFGENFRIESRISNPTLC